MISENSSRKHSPQAAVKHCIPHPEAGSHLHTDGKHDSEHSPGKTGRQRQHR